MLTVEERVRIVILMAKLESVTLVERQLKKRRNYQYPDSQTHRDLPVFSQSSKKQALFWMFLALEDLASKKKRLKKSRLFTLTILPHLFAKHL